MVLSSTRSLKAWLVGSCLLGLVVTVTLFACTCATSHGPDGPGGDAPEGIPLGSDEIRTKLETVDGSTRVRGEVKALVSAPAARVWAVLRSPDNFQTIHTRFSESRLLSKQTVDEILRRRSALDDDDLEALFLAADERRVSAAGPDPGTYRYFYRHLDMPFPVSDRWVVMRETQDESKRQEGTYRLVHDRVDGSMEHYRSVWRVSRVGENESLVQLTTDMDMGFRVPEFLLSLGKDEDMPDSVKAIRTLVRQ